MEREQIVREDFPTARKGWSPEAVRVHLIAVAEALSDGQKESTPAADATSERVQAVIGAAESAAAEIVSEAHAEADRTLGAARAESEQIRAAARTESEQTVTAANREATGRVEQARGAVEGLIAQADKLRTQVAALGKDLASSMPGTGPTPAENVDEIIEAEPLVVPDAAPEPIRKADQEQGTAASTEDLISQLRGAESPVAESEPVAPAISGSDLGAARLVAMNMALEGASRADIEKQLKAEFGQVENAGLLLDDVLRRANR